MPNAPHVARPAELAFATPRKLPHAQELRGRVVVVDVAFASDASSGGFEKITLPFIEQLGPRLAGWVDHHDHVLHVRYRDRKSTRLNSSHSQISYAVFCLKKKKNKK